jgi:hypothetical protein
MEDAINYKKSSNVKNKSAENYRRDYNYDRRDYNTENYRNRKNSDHSPREEKRYKTRDGDSPSYSRRFNVFRNRENYYVQVIH